MIAAAQFRAELASVRDARQFVRHATRHVLTDDASAVCVLLTSELFTNAVVHARSPVRIAVTSPDSVVRVAVTDRSLHLPVPGAVGEMDERGRGLNLVDQLSHEWGTTPNPEGKTVWFSLRRDR